MGRKKIHYTQPIYKNYRLECLWIRVDCESIKKVLVLGPERRSNVSFLLETRIHLYWAISGEMRADEVPVTAQLSCVDLL